MGYFLIQQNLIILITISKLEVQLIYSYSLIFIKSSADMSAVGKVQKLVFSFTALPCADRSMSDDGVPRIADELNQLFQEILFLSRNDRVWICAVHSEAQSFVALPKFVDEIHNAVSSERRDTTEADVLQISVGWGDGDSQHTNVLKHWRTLDVDNPWLHFAFADCSAIRAVQTWCQHQSALEIHCVRRGNV